ncbi:ABC transporter substrate-binding protein [Amycolatopsis sp. FDAARGOS 1241]|uniref:substrate-binding periplasmic protein n=1 Tax=Amycolatopsis sp. FDAARGOS 1241 TaxID=2778070 RepID=UPI00194F8646|nr:ABC transporter substrate-binding protein [Amycolatopsis sp. FDAARGOS 1241]QRP50138.1 amino acid ABC transporter substrate-binding protein [Amycolatopsis sp. FDAARGOS 1241]
MRRFPRTAPVLLAAVLAVSACSSSAGADGSGSGDGYGLAVPGTITAAVPQGDAPFVSPDATGKPAGMLIDLNNLIAQRMGLKITYKLSTVGAGLPQVTAGQYDMMIADLTMSEERKRNVAFTTPFYVDANDVLVRSDSPVKAVADVAGKRIGAGIGSAQADFAAKALPQANVVSVQTNATGIDQLLNGNLDGFVVSSVQAITVFAQHPGRLKVGVSVQNPIPEAMAVRKGLEKFLTDYDKQLAAVVDDGTFLKLYHKYFPGQEYPSSLFQYWPSLQAQVRKETPAGK